MKLHGRVKQLDLQVLVESLVELPCMSVHHLRTAYVVVSRHQPDIICSDTYVISTRMRNARKAPIKCSGSSVSTSQL